MAQLERIRRITEMEARMDRVQTAAAALEQALDAWEAAQTELEPLARYYASPLWREDFEADEAGELPPDLKRGVPSRVKKARDLPIKLKSPSSKKFW